MKRRFPSLLLGLLLLPASPVHSEPDRIDQATTKGTTYLISKQDKRGAIRETDAHETAITALSALAIAATGNLPSDHTPGGEAVQNALTFLLAPERQDREGYFGAKDGSRMYGHGITTLFLAEMLGMGRDADQDATLRRACQNAVDLILRAQQVKKRPGTEGGWRYTPQATDSDLSVTIWQLMALRSAKNAGLVVPKDAIDAAIGYIKRSFKDTGRLNTPVGFSYEISQSPVWSTAAEGLLALQVCGEYGCKEVAATSDWLLQNPPKTSTSWFYYGTYYYSQGMYQRGGEHAETGAKRSSEVLLPLQEEDGSWKSTGGSEGNRVYRTAMAVLSLSVKYHYLPIYQR
ncbi:MAG: hypothetical protein DVB28_001579 [Verrucomicrobia bacterium]|nr:MAG: hypothetical protein DVB28_001579 [Verrucomicrobiota bacterium]